MTIATTFIAMRLADHKHLIGWASLSHFAQFLSPLGLRNLWQVGNVRFAVCINEELGALLASEMLAVRPVRYFVGGWFSAQWTHLLNGHKSPESWKKFNVMYTARLAKYSGRCVLGVVSGNGKNRTLRAKEVSNGAASSFLHS